MNSATGRASDAVSSGMSRCESRPASAWLPLVSSIRKLLALWRRISSRASAIVAVRTSQSGCSITYEWRDGSGTVFGYH